MAGEKAFIRTLRFLKKFESALFTHKRIVMSYAEFRAIVKVGGYCDNELKHTVLDKQIIPIIKQVIGGDIPLITRNVVDESYPHSYGRHGGNSISFNAIGIHIPEKLVELTHEKIYFPEVDLGNNRIRPDFHQWLDVQNTTYTKMPKKKLKKGIRTILLDLFEEL